MSEKMVLMKLMECSAEVTRNLSPWCRVLPLVDVSLLLDTIYVSLTLKHTNNFIIHIVCVYDVTLQVYFTPNVYHAIMTVVDSAKILTNTDVTISSGSDTLDDKKGNIPDSHMTYIQYISNIFLRVSQR